MDDVKYIFNFKTNQMKLVTSVIITFLYILWNSPWIVFYGLISTWYWDINYLNNYVDDMLEAFINNLKKPKN